MKTDLKLSDVELTGEYRVPTEGEYYLEDTCNEYTIGQQGSGKAIAPFTIVRPKAKPEPKPRRWVFESTGESEQVQAGKWYRGFGHESQMSFFRSTADLTIAAELVRLVESPEETGAAKPSRKLKGEWRFRPTGVTRWVEYGEWARKDNGDIFRWEKCQCSLARYEILELIEEPREVVEMPDELVFVRRDKMPRNESFVIVNERGWLFDIGNGVNCAYYTLKPGQLGASQPKEDGR